MLRVELAEHGGDAAAGDGLVAAGAERAAHRVVVRLAVRQPVVLEEVAAHEGLLKVQREYFGGSNGLSFFTVLKKELKARL